MGAVEELWVGYDIKKNIFFNVSFNKVTPAPRPYCVFYAL
jgi:hypothetical protein